MWSPKRVEEAAVIVCVSPKLNNVPFTVIEEFWRAELGRLREEDAAMKGMPVAPVTTNPLLPIPHVVEVPKSVESWAVEVFQIKGKRAEIEVVPKVEEPPEYCGMLRVPLEYVAAPEEPDVVKPKKFIEEVA